MVRNTFVAFAAATLALGLMASTASARTHHSHPVRNSAVGAPAAQAPASPQAGEIQGVNPMINAKPQAPVQNAQPYQKTPGVNPM